jgi:hypothetical protein
MPAGSTSLRLLRSTEDTSADDVEISVRVFADGGSITVKRRTVVMADGSRRTTAIDALVR